MSRRFSDQDLTIWRALVAVLLPPAHTMPGGQEVGVADGGLDQVVKLRPDIVPDLLRGLRLFAAQGNLEALQEDMEAWHAVRLAAFGAYYTAPEVQAILRYTGQAAQPIDPDETPDWMARGLLDPVKARGPIWADPKV